MKNLVIRTGAACLAVALLTVGCSSESNDGMSTGNPDGGTGGSGGGGNGADAKADAVVEGGHTLTLAATLKATGDQVTFLTPSVTPITVPAASLVGKPYMVATFPAGFSPGNDPDLDHTWGSVPADLRIRYTSPAIFKDGAYDTVLVVYVNTPITDEIKKGSVQFAPAAKGGDLATFTADMSVVRPGDPSIPAGLIRLNVQGADAEAAVDNKVTTDPAQIAAALVNTVMIIP